LAPITSKLWQLRQLFLNDGAARDPDKPGRQTPKRFSGTITQLGPNGSTAKWVFTGGWVCKWEGPDFDATKNEISIETIEIAHEGLLMISGGETTKHDNTGGGGSSSTGGT
jgi:phage tail-like protein